MLCWRTGEQEEEKLKSMYSADSAQWNLFAFQKNFGGFFQKGAQLEEKRKGADKALKTACFFTGLE